MSLEEALEVYDKMISLIPTPHLINRSTSDDTRFACEIEQVRALICNSKKYERVVEAARKLTDPRNFAGHAWEYSQQDLRNALAALDKGEGK